MTTCNFKEGGGALALAAALAMTASVPRSAHAQQAEDQAAARSLFEEGRRLLKKGQYPEACEKLEAASKLYASPGILLNLGDCYDKVGKTASAWTEFGEAASAAGRAHRNDQESEGRRRQAAEEPKLTRLKIHVTTEVTGLAITRDGTQLASAAWGTPIPVDPGTHEIRAEAPGHEPWVTSVTASGQGQTVSVDVPELAASPTAAPSPSSQPQADASSGAGSGKAVEAPTAASGSHTLDWVLIGGGAAVGIAGGVLWGIGSSDSFAARSEKSATAQSDYSNAQTLFYAGIVGVVVGGVAAAAGVVLLTTSSGSGSSSASTATLRALPWATPGSGGMAVSGAW